MENNNKPLKVNALPLKNGGYAMALTYCDGQSAENVFRPSGTMKWVPAPYEARSGQYKKAKKASTGFYQAKENPFAFWETETTQRDFIDTPPAFTYVEHKAQPPALTPKFKSDYEAIKYLLKEIELTDVRIASGAAFFTHTKGSFSFRVVNDEDSKNDGTLTMSQVVLIHNALLAHQP